MSLKGLKPEWMSTDELAKLDIDTLRGFNNYLQEAIEKARKGELKGSEPHISIWYDRIGTEIHFDDGSMSCRDFGGNDTEHFVDLMRAISEHNWNIADSILKRYFMR